MIGKFCFAISHHPPARPEVKRRCSSCGAFQGTYSDPLFQSPATSGKSKTMRREIPHDLIMRRAFAIMPTWVGTFQGHFKFQDEWKKW